MTGTAIASEYDISTVGRTISPIEVTTVKSTL